MGTPSGDVSLGQELAAHGGARICLGRGDAKLLVQAGGWGSTAGHPSRTWGGTISPHTPPVCSHLLTTHPTAPPPAPPPPPSPGARWALHSPSPCPFSAWRTPASPPHLSCPQSVPTGQSNALLGEPLLPEPLICSGQNGPLRSTSRDTCCLGVLAWHPLPPAAAHTPPPAPQHLWASAHLMPFTTHPSTSAHEVCPRHEGGGRHPTPNHT